MSVIFNPDFKDFIQALNQHQVEYVLIGGYAVILHGYARTTGDLDIWLRKTSDNYRKLKHAFATFRMPMFDLTEENFLYNEDFDVFSFGVPPVSIDLLTHAEGLSFDTAYDQAQFVEIEGFKVRLVSLRNLIDLKKASNRAKDINDIEHLPEPNDKNL